MSSVTNKENADPTYIITLINGYRYSKVLFTAVEFKLFDHLVNEPLSLEELANKLNLAYPSTLERFLNACIALKLIKQDKTNKKYENTQLSEKYLTSTSSTTLNGYINHNNQDAYLYWRYLPNAIRENAPQWKQIVDINLGNEFNFDGHYHNENAESLFVSGMHGSGLMCYPLIIASMDTIQQYKKFCDVGGATGCLAVSACEVNPNLEAIIFDLPRIEKYAIEYINKTLPNIRNRIHFQSGDFFNDPLPQVDLFGLGRILHDWDDERCEKLLTKIYQTLPDKNGAILIAEKLLNEDKIGPINTNMQDLNMLLGCVGKERTSNEFKHMLEKIGFKNIKYQQTDKQIDAIIAYK